ncbi:MAG: MFS transporter [Nocardioidaceae bacterium]
MRSVGRLPRAGSSGLALVGLLTADMIYGFQQTAITPVLPVVQQDLGASREWTVWLFSGYLIVASVAPVFLGKLADRVGQRRVYLGSLLVFLVGSIGAALAPTIHLLVFCRLVQGVGGVVFPLSFAMATGLLSRDRVTSGIGLLTGSFGVGALLGFPFGGLISQTLSWRWIFGVGAVALALAMLLVRLTIPSTPPRERRGLDTPGAVLFGGAMAALIVAITEGPQRGWAAPLPVGMFVLAAVAGVCWYFREMNTTEPLMDLRVLRSRGVLLTNVTALLGGYAVFGINIMLPYLLQGAGASESMSLFGLAAGPLLTGVVLLPRALGQVVGGPLTNPLVKLFGPATPFAAGMVLVTLATCGLAFARDELWMIFVELAALGLGFGLTVSLSGSIVALAAEPGQTGIATSITTVLRRAGGGVGAQVSVAVLAAITLPGGDEPAPEAFTVAFGIAAAVALAGAVTAAFVAPRRVASREP